ncbi:DUF4399 domain-containing protein [Marinobacterium sp. CAU 1594]|nr:DUF4399 domain-containing protein [Marinobacterium arenosum]
MQLASGLLLSGFVVTSALAGDAAPVDKWVYIISPSDGATVSSPVTVRFGLQGMGVAPAGTDKANTGHHHLLVDGEQLPDMSQPMGKEVMHFGGGQTETTLELAPGRHTLQLILGDQHHRPHHPPLVSDRITIEVK